MSSAEDRHARLVLSLVAEPGDPRLTGLVSELGPAAVLAALRARCDHGDIGAALAERLRAARPDDALASAGRQGIRFVVPDDDEWPASVGDLAHVAPLHERGGTPVGLWLRGPLRLDEAVEDAVAVVGSRSATTYGAAVAGEIGSSLAEAGRTVVSGAAFGIDQAAHRGALAGRGPTVAVLACGVDRAYPLAHAALLQYIADVGLVISEAAPGFAPTRIRFLARNRLIAALTRGTVVVEAAVRSGALNTANWAASLSRTLMGVPGPVTSAPSQGVHEMIRTRDALLVTGGRDVLEATAPAGQFVADRPVGAIDARDCLSAEQRQVLDAVPVRAGVEAARIARTAGMTAGRTLAVLKVLKSVGLVEHGNRRWRLAPPPSRLPDPKGASS